MEKAMTITYEVGNNLYLNITNHCPCACTFCIRSHGDGAYGSESLWLEHEPTQDEIFRALRERDLFRYDEVVFCGFGEPTERLEVLRKTARFARSHGAQSIRLNTNGLSDLINGYPTATRLSGHIDTVSISLNAGTEDAYLAITRPRFGTLAFSALQKFARSCRLSVPHTMLTVVDILPEEEMAAAQALAKRLELPLRVRKYED